MIIIAKETKIFVIVVSFPKKLAWAHKTYGVI